MKSTPSTMSTSDQLREARLRIAALERELEVLRATTSAATAHITQHDDTTTATNNFTSHRHPTIPPPSSYSDVSRDHHSQSQLSANSLQQTCNPATKNNLNSNINNTTIQSSSISSPLINSAKPAPSTPVLSLEKNVALLSSQQQPLISSNLTSPALSDAPVSSPSRSPSRKNLSLSPMGDIKDTSRQQHQSSSSPAHSTLTHCTKPQPINHDSGIIVQHSEPCDDANKPTTPNIQQSDAVAPSATPSPSSSPSPALLPSTSIATGNVPQPQSISLEKSTITTVKSINSTPTAIAPSPMPVVCPQSGTVVAAAVAAAAVAATVLNAHKPVAFKAENQLLSHQSNTSKISNNATTTCTSLKSMLNKSKTHSITKRRSSSCINQLSSPHNIPTTINANNNVSSNAKKDRATLVAKCTEPKPGQTRYWTEEEHLRFLDAIAKYGDKAYVAISNYVETRTPKQVRTHAQKFQMKMARQARQSLEAGQPIQMPPGMCPVIEVPMGSKSTIVPITPEQTAKLCSTTGGTIDPTTIVSTLSSCQSAVRQGYAKKRGVGKTAKSQRLKHHQIQQQQEQQPQQQKHQVKLQRQKQLHRESNHVGTQHLPQIAQIQECQKVQTKHLDMHSDAGVNDADESNCMTDAHDSCSLSSKLKKEDNSLGKKLVSRIIMEDEVKNIEEEEDITMMDTDGSDSGSCIGRSPKRKGCDKSKDNIKTATASTKGSDCDESCSSLSDPCDQYITGDEGSDDTTNEEMELELKLKQTLDGSTEDDVADVEISDGVVVGMGAGDENTFLTSPKRITKEAVAASKVVDVDDDLEDLDKLEDGDLVLAPFANPTESWLLPDSSADTLI